MLKQRPIVYLALLVGLGGLLVAGVSVNRVLFVGLFAFMLMMNLGGQGGHGGHGWGTNEDAVAHGLVAPAPEEDEVAGK